MSKIKIFNRINVRIPLVIHGFFANFFFVYDLNVSKAHAYQPFQLLSNKFVKYRIENSNTTAHEQFPSN